MATAQHEMIALVLDHLTKNKCDLTNFFQSLKAVSIFIQNKQNIFSFKHGLLCVFSMATEHLCMCSRLNTKWLHWSWTDLGLISIIILQFFNIHTKNLKEKKNIFSLKQVVPCVFFQWQQSIYVLTAQHEMIALVLDRFRLQLTPWTWIFSPCR